MSEIRGGTKAVAALAEAKAADFLYKKAAEAADLAEAAERDAQRLRSEASRFRAIADYLAERIDSEG